ncbi:S-adenosylmethionine tRNA ribosyltransferase [Candidatus Termititenax persephonae]|uniref:S-adenosylmethionine:tRNA ribosyltransferase-isomerase n=1 Tax=Candidatus Termititenax persephonae TaxID=2218525 RepID=A0A388TJ29_9BACT|nr:S-adenosylmethionine tRNA ribosyltransferase [Candidatus Termititenax persephonae]
MSGEFSADLYDYHLPPELIAQRPAARREDSRLMVLSRQGDALEHKYFRDLPGYLTPADLLIFNDTKVLPARLSGQKDSGARCELLLLKRLGEKQWEALVKPGRRLPAGSTVHFGAELSATVLEILPAGRRRVELCYPGDFWAVLDRHGQTPLPPYINQKPTKELAERYQTVYAREPGAAAAPTAGLHFSTDLLAKIKAKGVATAFVTLHVGLGTFRPLQTGDIREHKMHAEEYSLPAETVRAIAECRARAGRVVAVGTTAARVLETWAQEAANDANDYAPRHGQTAIYIYPGYRFKAVDALITNFHLPRSTLLLLVSALAGRAPLLQAYQEAVRQKYRFFSFGDAMLIK